MLQARWPDDDAALCLPHVADAGARALTRRGYKCLGDFVHASRQKRAALSRDLNAALSAQQAEECVSLLDRMPAVTMTSGAPTPRAAAQRCTGDEAAAADHERAGNSGEDAAAQADELEVTVTLQRQGQAAGGGKGRPKGANGGQRARVYAPRCV